MDTKKKKYFILKDEPNWSKALMHEYNLHVTENDKGKEYSLVTSDSEEWTQQHRNREVVNVFDDGGDNIKIKLDGKRIQKTITYADLEQLRLVLNFIAKIEPGPKYTIIEECENTIQI